MSEDSWSWDKSRIERELSLLEKEIRSLKTKLDNSIIDIRAVNYWGWVQSRPMKSKVWDVVRHEIQYKRQGSPEWVSLQIVHRDLDDNNMPIPTGELEE